MYKISKRGASFVVADDVGRFTGRMFSSRDEAERCRRALMGEPPLQVRTCMSCGKLFESDGPHNRMCRSCKRSKVD
jgi:hypothetical protein